VQIEACPGTFPVTRRPFTINRCSPADGTIEIVFDVVGRGTTLMSRAVAGGTVRLLGPLGNGYCISGGTWLLIGGGMGAAGFPFLGERANVAVTCVGAVSERKILPGCPGEVRVATEDGSAGRKGLVTSLLSDAPWEMITDVAVCGSPAMMNAVRERVPESHRDSIQVSTESRMGCGWGVCEGCVIPGEDRTYLKCCSEGPVFRSGEIDWERWIEVTG
jgi:dihydroorotate dehydrogenase electron transfer subunit